MTCQSGVTALCAGVAYDILGGEKSILYDGSWNEYGSIDEPDFSHGVKGGIYDEKVNEAVDRFIESRLATGKAETIKKYFAKRKMETKME